MYNYCVTGIIPAQPPEGERLKKLFDVPRCFQWNRVSLKAFFGTKLERPAGAKERNARLKGLGFCTPHPPATVLQTLIINDLGCYKGATNWLNCSTCSTLASHPPHPLMATAAWRPESRRHLPHFYSTENSEEPFLTTKAANFRQGGARLCRAVRLGCALARQVTG
jgi:hypothetical protein